MTGAHDALHALADALARVGARWFLIGAQAVIVHGAPRLTGDIDVTVHLGEIGSARLLAELVAGGFTVRVDDPLAFADATRVLPLWHAPSGYGVDVLLGSPGVDELFLGRAVERNVEGLSIRVVSAADLIAMKLLAGRPKDIEDVVGVLSAQGAELDLATVRSTLRMFEGALDRRDLLPALDAARARAATSSSSTGRSRRRRRKPSP